MTYARALVVGATSDIARAFALRMAEGGTDLLLAARRPAELAGMAADLRRDHRVDVRVLTMDLLSHEAAAALVRELEPMPDLVAIFAGVLAPGPDEHPTLEQVEIVLRTNLLGCAAVLEAAAVRLEERGTGALVGVSSVAGERGRRSNYLYGSSKAGLTAYMSGLRARLRSSGVRVLTVKPGFVRTRMTAGRSLPPLVTADPDRVARAICRGLKRGRRIVYVPWPWRWIMAGVRALPEPVFERLRF